MNLFDFLASKKIDQILMIVQDIQTIVKDIQSKGVKETMTLDELKTQVDANTSVEQSAITLINGLAAQIAAVATDPAKVQALADELKTSATALSTAITANTPAAPTT